MSATEEASVSADVLPAPEPSLASAERRESWRYLLALLPAFLLLAALFVYPLLGIVNRSVYKAGYTLESYRQICRSSPASSCGPMPGWSSWGGTAS